MLMGQRSLYSYTNGNYQVTLLKDGTKIRECKGSVFRPDFPESMDIKITNWCNMGEICTHCHEASYKNGKQGNLQDLLNRLVGLPPGVELAIGGGNPLSHDDLDVFLDRVRKMGLVPNITINELHLNEIVQELLLDWQGKKSTIRDRNIIQ